ncbi:MAG: hypothetical protein ACI3ZD_15980 [Prevotella sp.]
MAGKKRLIEVSEQEYDLIETGRNYRKSFPRGEPQIRYYLERLFTEWLDGEEY